MSIMRCERHDRSWDSDKLDECPLCKFNPGYTIGLTGDIEWDRPTPQPPNAAHGNVSTEGNGKVSVPVADIVNSPKVHRQVQAVRELQAATAAAPQAQEMPEEPFIFYLSRSGYAGNQPAVWLSDYRRMRAYAELKQARAGEAHSELLAIHKICLCVADCPPVEPGDTATVRMVKDLAHLVNRLSDNACKTEAK